MKDGSAVSSKLAENVLHFTRLLCGGERELEKERELLDMFNEAAGDVTEEDIEERESLLGGFAGGVGD